MNRFVTERQMRDAVLGRIRELGHAVTSFQRRGEFVFTITSQDDPPFDKREVIVHPRRFEQLLQAISPNMLPIEFEYRRCDAAVKGEIDKIVNEIIGPMRCARPVAEFPFRVGQSVIVVDDQYSEFSYVIKGQTVTIEEVHPGPPQCAATIFPDGNTVVARSADGNLWQLDIRDIATTDEEPTTKNHLERLSSTSSPLTSAPPG